MTIALLICVSGSARRYPGGEVMVAGDTFEVNMDTVSTLPVDDLPAMISDIEEAPALGTNGREDGVIAIEAVGGPLKVRMYLDSNSFTDPDADQYQDCVITDGKTLTTGTIDSNAKTLVVMG